MRPLRRSGAPVTEVTPGQALSPRRPSSVSSRCQRRPQPGASQRFRGRKRVQVGMVWIPSSSKPTAKSWTAMLVLGLSTEWRGGVGATERGRQRGRAQTRACPIRYPMPPGCCRDFGTVNSLPGSLEMPHGGCGQNGGMGVCVREHSAGDSLVSCGTPRRRGCQFMPPSTRVGGPTSLHLPTLAVRPRVSSNLIGKHSHCTLTIYVANLYPLSIFPLGSALIGL